MFAPFASAVSVASEIHVHSSMHGDKMRLILAAALENYSAVTRLCMTLIMYESLYRVMPVVPIRRSALAAPSARCARGEALTAPFWMRLIDRQRRPKKERCQEM
jgi:hypothetical protein